jgi:lysophospholipase
LNNPLKGYVETYGDYVADLVLFVETVVVPRLRPPLILMAHSMGGNIALHFLERAGMRVDLVILSAPMIRINLSPKVEKFARLLSSWATRMGMGHAAVPSMGRSHAFLGDFEGNALTSSRQRFDAVKKMMTANPNLAVHLVTFGWLNASFKAMDHIHCRGFARHIEAPVAVVVAGKDRVVCNRAIYRLAGRLRNKHITTISGARHEILQEKPNLRSQFWRAFDRAFG